MHDGNKKWLVITAVAILIGVGAAGFMFFRGSSKKAAPTPSPTPFVEQPTETPEPSVNKADLKIKILNGSGTVGEAGKVQKILEGADYKIDSTGNADTYDHKTTDIQAKKAVPSSVTDELEKLLHNDYTVSTSLLGDDENVDIIIVIGARKNAPSASPKPTASSQTSPTPKATENVSVSPTVTPSPSPKTP